MKLVDVYIKNDRMHCKVLGIQLFTHKIKKVGKKNIVVLIKENGQRVYNPKIKGLFVKFKGSWNIVKIYEPINLGGVSFTLKNKDRIEVRQSKNDIQNLHIESCGHSRVFIDEDFSIANGTFVVDYGSSVKIGKDCMFSFNIVMQTSDEHIIYDGNTKQFIGTNDIVVGDHVWAGLSSKILKKSVIPNGCIIGMDSTVTKAFSEENGILVGSPARMVKTNIFWDREHYTVMKSDKLENEFIEKFSKQG